MVLYEIMIHFKFICFVMAYKGERLMKELVSHTAYANRLNIKDYCQLGKLNLMEFNLNMNIEFL